jgi:hypothetical protein
MPTRHDREFWENACREVLAGAKATDVARRLGVRPRTLQWWSWKLRNDGVAKPAKRVAKRAQFLPVVVSEITATVGTTSLELETNGVRVRVQIGSDVQYVATLVAALRDAC